MDYAMDIAIVVGVILLIIAIHGVREIRKNSQLLMAACRHAHELISYNWETEELAVEWLLGHKSGALGNFLNSPSGERLLSDDHGYKDVGEALLKEFVLRWLNRNDLIECDVSFWTRDEVRSEWSNLTHLSEERRSRFEAFLNEDNDAVDGMNGNAVRITEWLNAIMTPSDAQLHLKRAENLIRSGVPVLPVLRLRKRHASDF